MKRTMANQAFDLSILQEVAWETSKPSSKAQRLGNGVTVLQVTKRRACGVDCQIRILLSVQGGSDSFRERLRERVIEITKQYGRHGYRTMAGSVEA